MMMMNEIKKENLEKSKKNVSKLINIPSIRISK